MTQIARPRRNRVTPFGDIVAHPARGTLLGNRGDLHAPDGSLGATTSRSKAWISCQLHWPGKRLEFDRPGSYYPLFFYDEAVALAAGHRPCGFCRANDLARFKRAWQVALGRDPSAFISVREIDAALHVARSSKRTVADLGVSGDMGFANGVFVELTLPLSCAALCWNGEYFPWAFGGYGNAIFNRDVKIIRVLTPSPTVQVLAAGYLPAVAGI